MTERVQRRAVACRNRCGHQVFRFTDDIGHEHQVYATPHTGPLSGNDVFHVWYFRSRWAGWIPYVHAKKGAEGKTIHLEHFCTRALVTA